VRRRTAGDEDSEVDEQGQGEKRRMVVVTSDEKAKPNAAARERDTKGGLGGGVFHRGLWGLSPCAPCGPNEAVCLGLLKQAGVKPRLTS
jgi:hypothetical protein